MDLGQYFLDPVLRAPTIVTMVVCFVAALLGTFIVLRKEALLGEVFSHMALPGVVVALIAARFFSFDSELITISFVTIGAFCFTFLGALFISFLKRKGKLVADSALSFALVSFFGLGLLILSGLQQDFPSLYRKSESYLFGQAATLDDSYIVIYLALAAFVLIVSIIFFRPIKVLIFDEVFAQNIGMPKKTIEAILFVLVVLSCVMGLKSVGVVLITSMLIFPPLSAREFTKRVSMQFALSGLFGIFAGFLGVVFSYELSLRLSQHSQKAISLPLGPMITLVAFGLFLITLIVSPRQGFLKRGVRKWTFSFRCEQENLLKAIWKYCSVHDKKTLSRQEIEEIYPPKFFSLFFLLHKKFIRRVSKNEYEMTSSGLMRGRKIVRLHRLWEVYLVKFCKVPKERVHPSAEEMEHILTREIEEELDRILGYPKLDPHKQPIPQQDETIYESLLRP